MTHGYAQMRNDAKTTREVVALVQLDLWNGSIRLNTPWYPDCPILIEFFGCPVL
jgi:hypothetical protein